jgi:hypothetical protein
MNITVTERPDIPASIQRTDKKRTLLFRRYADKLSINGDLSRAIVSFQANKNVPFYRWLKYKEAFSSELVRFFIDRFRPVKKGAPKILDPFAGAGTTLTTATKAGWNATGIELLPVGVAAMKARLKADTVDIRLLENYLLRLEKYHLEKTGSNFRFPHLRITEKAFRKETERAIASYMTFLNEIEEQDVRYLFWFACLSILEEVSFTRKDGQYLRWDYRSERDLRSNFDKGVIPDFRHAITNKLNMMLEDIKRRNGGSYSRNVKIIEGSCLKEMPHLAAGSFDLILTSPPYCNRYDYTRTYAVELAFIGYDEETLKNLRQTLLSATVENKSKREQLFIEYKRRNKQAFYNAAAQIFDKQSALHEVLGLLYEAKNRGELNNNNIPNMIENYFFEMNLIVHELSRVLAPGGHIIMVNDNVRYHGEEIPVDLILSDFAAGAGLTVDCIWVLPRGKGNSSQQMGAYGRNELRKCVYVWTKCRGHFIQ